MNIQEKNAVNAYCGSMSERLAQSKADLEELSSIANQSGLSRHQYLSCERLLQVLTESCIGLAKHLVKSKGRFVSADAYQAFEQLNELSVLSDVDLVRWKKIIGMRKALVHDYLNIDKSIVENVISGRQFEFLFDFANLAMKLLQED